MAPKTSSLFFLSMSFVFIFMFPTSINAFSIKLIPIHTAFPQNRTFEEQETHLYQISKTRLASMSPNFTTSLTGELTRAPNSYYLTPVQIGSVPYSPYLMVDTGASLTWVQTEGCEHCFEIAHDLGNYNPSASDTYRAVMRSNRHLCFTGQHDQHRRCAYTIDYGTGGHSSGWIALDHFSFTHQQHESSLFLFGCGINNQVGFTTAEPNRVGGLFGLAAGPESFLRQQIAITQLRFSHCLPSRAGTQTFIRFGEEAGFGEHHEHEHIVTTPLAHDESKYIIKTVNDISIGTRQLGLDPRLFEVNHEHGLRGFVVDSGTPYTFLIRPAYHAVAHAVIEYFAEHDIHPLDNPNFLCFRFNSNRVHPPDMTFHFEGGDFVVSGSHVFGRRANGVSCLRVVDGGHANLLGGLQLVEHKVVFDVHNWQMSFAPVHCDEHE